MSLLQGMGRHTQRRGNWQEGRKEAIGDVLRNFLLIAFKSLKIASHPAVPFTHRLAWASPCPPLDTNTHTLMHATSNAHTRVNAVTIPTHPHTHIHTHTSKTLLRPPPGFSPVYLGIQVRPWPDWGADSGFLWCWVSCAALSASSPALGHILL